MTSFSPIIVGTMRLGLWDAQFSKSDMQTFIEGCLEMQATTFDHADIYGDYTTEADFGAVLKDKPSLRPQMQLITKCGIRRVCAQRPDHQVKSYDSSSQHIISSVENSLRALGTDYIDVLLLHRPDFLMHPDEVAEVFIQLKEEGKVLNFGVSNFSPSQFNLLDSRFPLMANQVEVSILQPRAFSDGTLDQCLKHQALPMAWSPLGGGAIFSDLENPRIDRIRQVARLLAEVHDASLDQILYAWIMNHPSGILPVTGTTKLSRVQSAIDAKDIRFSRQEWYELYQASTGETIA